MILRKQQYTRFRLREFPQRLPEQQQGQRQISARKIGKFQEFQDGRFQRPQGPEKREKKEKINKKLYIKFVLFKKKQNYPTSIKCGPNTHGVENCAHHSH